MMDDKPFDLDDEPFDLDDEPFDLDVKMADGTVVTYVGCRVVTINDKPLLPPDDNAFALTLHALAPQVEEPR
jgi:hypothetical protein